MGREKSDELIYFSALHGRTMYRRVKSAGDPFPDAPWPVSQRTAAHQTAGGRTAAHRTAGSAGSEQGCCPILSSWWKGGGGSAVFLRRIEIRSEAHFRGIVERIHHPPRTDGILWPVDLVALSDAQGRERMTSVERCYIPAEYCQPVPRPPASFALAFRMPPPRAGFRSLSNGGCEGIPPVELRGSVGSSTPQPFGIQLPRVRAAAVSLLKILDALNRDGYYYNDFHLSRVFRAENGQILLDYSDLIWTPADAASRTDTADSYTAARTATANSYTASRTDTADSYTAARTATANSYTASRTDTADGGVEEESFPNAAYPLEFADPAVIRGLIPVPDDRSQNYSLCAFLFYLLFGRCPYDGDALKSVRDDTPVSHYRKFAEWYHEIEPVFIFDPEDERNSLGFQGQGLVCEDDKYITQWLNAPDRLKEMFIHALAKRNVFRQSSNQRGPAYPAPADWLRVL